MKIVDERKKGKRRNLSEVGDGEVVALDGCEGFWMKRLYENTDKCSLVSIVGGLTCREPKNLEVTPVSATVTITDA